MGIAYKIVSKTQRKEALNDLYQKAYDKYSVKDGFELNIFNLAYKKFRKELVRDKILNSNTRIDGRNLDDIRQIDCEISLLPKLMVLHFLQEVRHNRYLQLRSEV